MFFFLQATEVFLEHSRTFMLEVFCEKNWQLKVAVFAKNLHHRLLVEF